MFFDKAVRIEKIDLSALNIKSSINLSILREDLIHPIISGNKFRKLKYNLIEAKNLKAKSILTFGGAFSNHIAAVSYAGKINNIQTIGLIRGEELERKTSLNKTLSFAQSNGMQFIFLDRKTYKERNNGTYLEELKNKYPDSYIIPEGGTNHLAIKGCEEIITNNLKEYDIICCALGTAGTFIGLLNGKFTHQKLIGFSALKNSTFLSEIIQNYSQNKDYYLIYDYHFGGYAKVTTELFNFVSLFKTTYNIQLDYVYTGKMVFGLIDLIKKKYFKENMNILMIHTGGIQGNDGIISKFINKHNEI